MRLVKINKKIWVNPDHVITVVDEKEDKMVKIAFVGGDGEYLYSDFSAEETVKLLMTGHLA